MDTLNFIDTNIRLDFYRMKIPGGVLSILERIDKHHDIIITGDQVEMEYKKNRQKVILETLRQLRTTELKILSPPGFLSDAAPSKAISKKKEITTQQTRLRRRIERILRNPSRNDSV